MDNKVARKKSVKVWGNPHVLFTPDIKGRYDLEQRAWDRIEPGSGQWMVRLLSPFREQPPRVKSVTPDVMMYAPHAICWSRRVREVKLVPSSRIGEFEGGLKVTVVDSLQEFARKCVGDAINDSERVEIYNLMKFHLYGGSVEGHMRRLAIPYVLDLQSILHDLCCIFIALGTDAFHAFNSLLALWLFGWIPVGLAKDGSLLVLVAD